ncbi:magnesium transporter CorA family protein [Chelativorans sp. YIM 93263]|uniref:magnesium transporter CorA family protein n=1 Tax=Chelativorans sp. YIM 93263 TaxID=2906648 RepID=UPI002378E339|nr:magnesium transporter CorA family protein [Chelativorans sp. YIM 93263]
MIQVFCIEDDYLLAVEVQPGEALPDNALWIDLFNPSEDEDRAVETWTGADIPTSEDMVEIEETSRFYSEAGVQYLTVPILHTVDDEHRTVAPVSFVITGGRLVTVRHSDPKAFSFYINRATKPGNRLLGKNSNGKTVMIGLIEAVTDRLADLLENVTEDIDTASDRIYHRPVNSRPMSTKEFRRMLTRIGRQGTFLSKARESLSGIRRFVAYATTIMGTEKQQDLRTRIKALERDANSLENYVDFLSNKITFLLDTIVGLISVEQSAIIKVFSVAAVGFMPPTLIASIYGMNFDFMPELDERWGYPLALLLMFLSAALPLYYFRRKGWL